MSVTTETVAQAAQLAMLEIDSTAVQDATNSINDILALVDELKEVDTTHIEPMAHPLDATQPLRDDVVTAINNRDELIAGAPESADGQFLVPRVVE